MRLLSSQVLHKFNEANKEHRLPEVHSKSCLEAIKKAKLTEHKNDAKLMISMVDKDPRSAFNGSKTNLEAERKKIKAKLREKIKNARK
jgi:hypothetical protein